MVDYDAIMDGGWEHRSRLFGPLSPEEKVPE